MFAKCRNQMGVWTATEELAAVQTFWLVSAATLSRGGFLFALGLRCIDVGEMALQRSHPVGVDFCGHEEIAVRDDIALNEFPPDRQLLLLIGYRIGMCSIELTSTLDTTGITVSRIYHKLSYPKS